MYGFNNAVEMHQDDILYICKRRFNIISLKFVFLFLDKPIRNLLMDFGKKLI